MSRAGGDSESALLEYLAHELRTPLSLISGYAELLATRDDEESRREAALRIRDAVERLSKLLDALEDGRLGPPPTGT